MFKIILYSSHCPKCTQLQKLLDKQGISYEMEDDTDFMTKELGLTGSMPKLRVGDDMLEFADAWKWAKEHGKEA